MCNSTLTSATGEETLTPNSNECNSTLTSGTRGIYPHCYILMLMSGVTGYEFATRNADHENIGEIHYHKENKTNGGKQIEFRAESDHLKKKIKSGNK